MYSGKIKIKKSPFFIFFLLVHTHVVVASRRRHFFLILSRVGSAKQLMQMRSVNRQFKRVSERTIKSGNGLVLKVRKNIQSAENCKLASYNWLRRLDLKWKLCRAFSVATRSITLALFMSVRKSDRFLGVSSNWIAHSRSEWVHCCD